jgi:hypothetical protein
MESNSQLNPVSYSTQRERERENTRISFSLLILIMNESNIYRTERQSGMQRKRERESRAGKTMSVNLHGLDERVTDLTHGKRGLNS